MVFGHAPLLRDTSVIGTEARSPPPLTDYSYHLVRFHEAIMCLHTSPTLGMADYRNAQYTVSDGGKCLSSRKRGGGSSSGFELTSRLLKSWINVCFNSLLADFWEHISDSNYGQKDFLYFLLAQLISAKTFHGKTTLKFFGTKAGGKLARAATENESKLSEYEWKFQGRRCHVTWQVIRFTDLCKSTWGRSRKTTTNLSSD